MLDSDRQLIADALGAAPTGSSTSSTGSATSASPCSSPSRTCSRRSRRRSSCRSPASSPATAGRTLPGMIIAAHDRLARSAPGPARTAIAAWIGTGAARVASSCATASGSGSRPADVAKAERWFDRRAVVAVLVGRCVPLIRSLVSIPAGVPADALRHVHAVHGDRSLIWNTALIRRRLRRCATTGRTSSRSLGVVSVRSSIALIAGGHRRGSLWSRGALRPGRRAADPVEVAADDGRRTPSSDERRQPGRPRPRRPRRPRP